MASGSPISFSLDIQVGDDILVAFGYDYLLKRTNKTLLYISNYVNPII